MSRPASDPLAIFTPSTRTWFEGAFERPTPAQAGAWPPIAAGKHVLLSAPTGSGKTLAAFLSAIDRLSRAQDGLQQHATPAQAQAQGTKLLYISPLKALSYDIERNLKAPLKGIGVDISVAIRTGDTSSRQRASMLRKPPQILITTPESLYLLLTSKAAQTLRGVETVIVDEIHAIASTKRGAHLALTLERLHALIERSGGRGGPQRIGLSATQTPLSEVASFLVGPRRECEIVDATVGGDALRRSLDVEIEVPVESMEAPQESIAQDPLQPVSGGESLRNSIWPAIYPRLLQLVSEHHSTIVFVNSRRTAERVALRLNELGGSQSIARAHHGSLSREERGIVEEMLKAGTLPCLVATSSLELGIDMGAVDLVIQISSPKTVSSGLQRIGRAGHSFGEPSKGRVFPRFRGDLLECAVLVKRMYQGSIEPTVLPRNPLDVLAQQVVASAAIEGEVTVAELHRRARMTHSFSELSRAQLENVLDMLDGRYPSSEFSELAPRIVWDRARDVITPRKGAQRLAVTNAGTIPDRGLYRVVLPDGRFVGELDEEMVYEARAGQAFMLGASTWRIEEIGRDKVVVTPAPGAPGAVPFWHGDAARRSKELGEAIGAFARWAVDERAETLERDFGLQRSAAENVLALLREQRAATGVLPSDRTIVLERFRDEIGDWRLCVLSPYGGRIHAAWALAIAAAVRARLGVQAEIVTADDGIVMRLPDTEEPPGAELAIVDLDHLEEDIVSELGSSAMFGARFRESAARALLIPRAMPGRRTPLWQQRLKAESLLTVARRYSGFPIVLEAYRECLSDVLDVNGLKEILRKLQTREMRIVEVETETASPFAASLLFDFLATYMYEGDAPSAERRAAALSLDRDLLRELLGQEELRELMDEDALDAVEQELQLLTRERAARSLDEVHDMLRLLGDLTTQEIRRRCAQKLDVEAALQSLRRARRALSVRVAGERRWIDAADAGLYRDGLGVALPPGLPEAFVAEVHSALRRLLRRWSSRNGPFTTEALAVRYRLGRSVLETALRELEDSGEIVRGELRPGGVPGQREWCEVDVLRRLRRASLAALRKEIEPVDAATFAAFEVAWQGVDAHAAAGAGVQRLREALIPLQGLALTPATWERDVLPRRVGAYSPTWIDELCLGGEIAWVGAGAIGRSDGRVSIYFREDAAAIGPPRGAALAAERSLSDPLHLAVIRRLEAGACFLGDLLATLSLDAGADGSRAALDADADADADAGAAGGLQAPVDANGDGAGSPRAGRGAEAPAALASVSAPSAKAVIEALWDLVWAGVVSNDSFAPLRGRGSLARGGQRPSVARAATRRGFASRFAARRGGAAPSEHFGRWYLTASLFGPAAVTVDPSMRMRTTAELLLERYGVLTRELVRSEGVEGGFSALYGELSRLETVGAARRGYFVESLGAAQFALPGAVERLRSMRIDGVDDERAVVLAATDPAQPYGGALRWPESARRRGRGPARVPGAYVVLVNWLPCLYLERGGRRLLTLSAGDGVGARALNDTLSSALRGLADAARKGRIARLAIETIDGEPVIGSVFESVLLELGFSVGPRRLTLRAS